MIEANRREGEQACAENSNIATTVPEQNAELASKLMLRKVGEPVRRSAITRKIARRLRGRGMQRDVKSVSDHDRGRKSHAARSGQESIYLLLCTPGVRSN